MARPNAPTPSHLSPSGDWSFGDEQLYDAPVSPSSAYIVESPSTLPVSPTPRDPHLLSREGYDDESFVSEAGPSLASPHTQKISSLPDPSQYPDPYPSFRPPRWPHGMSTPALSSADSSSGSARSSAYTTSARSGDYGHVHVALGGPDDPNLSTGISTEDVAQLLARESSYSSIQGRPPLVDQSRWSEVYAQSVRSRSSSVGNGKAENVQDNTSSPALRGMPSFDHGWDTVDERDEIGLTSEDETDDEVMLDYDEDEEDEEQPSSAVVVAEEGRGIIVRGGELPIVQIHVHPGTFIPLWRCFVGVLIVGRYYTSPHWLLKHPECRSLVSHQHDPLHCHHFAGLGHLRQLPGRVASGSSGVCLPRGTEHCVQSLARSTRVSCRTDLVARTHCRFHGLEYSSTCAQRAGQAPSSEYATEQDELSAELVVPLAFLRDSARGRKPVPRAMEGSC